MYDGDGKDYFGGIGGSKKQTPPPNEPEQGPDHDDGDNLSIHVSKKKDGKFHSRIDHHDEMGEDEMEHDSVHEAAAAHAKALEDHYGEDRAEEAEEKVDPGIHKKAGAYLEKVMGE